MDGEPEQVSKTVNVLQQRHEELRTSHVHLKGAIRRNVHHVLVVKGAESATVQAFAEKSMATIAAWMMSTTLNACILFVLAGSTQNTQTDTLVSAAIYAALTAVAVPTGLWLLRGHTEDSSATILGDQKTLLNVCLPMFFAWAWKDLMSAVISSEGSEEFWPQLLAASCLTVVIGMAEALPCFRRSQQGVKAGDSRDTLCARIATMPAHLGLAVGYTWNAVFSWVPNTLIKKTNTGLFILMIQVVYYLIITSVITAVSIAWSRHHDTKAAADKQNLQAEQSRPDSENNDEQTDQRGDEQNEQQQKQPQQLAPSDDDTELGLTPESAMWAVTKAEHDLLEMSGQVFIDSLGFIYAWAQLDTVNAFFFNYMLGCESSTLCTYQSNFALAAAVTLIFTRLAHIWKMEHRHSAWNRQATVLVNKSLSLNVGWAWSNYCSTAVASASASSTVDPICTYLMCTGFAWLVMSFVHRKFQVEQRAWSRHVKQEVLTHGTAPN